MTNTPILTPEQLAERWGTNLETVWLAVDDERFPLPFVYLGRGKPERHGRGRRGLYRFRLSAIEAWERDREKCFPPVEEPATKTRTKAASLEAFGHDGVDRMVRTGRVKPDGKVFR